VRLAGALGRRIYPAAWAESDWVGGAAAAPALIDLVHPQARNAMTDLLVLQKQFVGEAANYTHGLAVNPAPRAGATIAAG